MAGRRLGLLGHLAGAAVLIVAGLAVPTVVLAAPAAGSVSSSQDEPPTYSNWPENPTNWPCEQTPSYACTQGGYNNTSAHGSGWPNSYYGAGQASTNAYGMHNCTLYAAFRLKENGFKDPGNWGNASHWATAAYNDHILVNQVPAVGSIAQWNAGGGGDGHVAYVEWVDYSSSGTVTGITITEDNFMPQSYPSNPRVAGGYTGEIHITAGSSVWPANFIHAKDTWPPSTFNGYEAAFQAAGTRQLYLFGNDGTGANPYTVAPGTSPAITSIGSGSYQVAFRNASDGNLYVAGVAGSSDTGYGIASGTSPSITTLSSGGYEVAFQAAGTGQLYLFGSAGIGGNPYTVASGTSPAIAALGKGSYEVAFRNASDGNLYMAGVDTGDTGLGIAPGTSPRITSLSNGGYEVAFQAAGSGQLWVYGDARTGPTQYTVAPRTSPAIASYGNGSYQVAFRNASDGNLYVAGGAGNTDTGLGIAPGTSPSIAALSTGGYEVAFVAAGTDHLYLSGNPDTGDTTLGVAASTSPSIS